MAVKVLELHHHGIRIGPYTRAAEQGSRLLPRRTGTDPRSWTPRDPGHPRVLDGFGPHADSPDGS